MIEIHMFGVRDSMGCYFAGKINNEFGDEGVASSDSLKDVFEMLLEMWPELRRMQPAGEANERNFGVKLERQGGE